MVERFSDRMGITERPRRTLLVDEISGDLRIAIWNLLFRWMRAQLQLNWDDAARAVAMHLVNVPADGIAYKAGPAFLRQIVMAHEWHEPYNLLEFMIGYLTRKLGIVPDRFYSEANSALEAEGSGYRFLNGKLAPIASREEVEAIDDAIGAADRAGLAGASTHLAAAVNALSQKPNPDYRNCIKEAILAVESVSSRISGERPRGLDRPLTVLADSVKIHPAMVAGFKKLYGFTSDEGGIRHALLDDPNVGFDEAKFMLVACSAFVNFLIAKADAAGLL